MATVDAGPIVDVPLRIRGSLLVLSKASRFIRPRGQKETLKASPTLSGVLMSGCDLDLFSDTVRPLTGEPLPAPTIPWKLSSHLLLKPSRLLLSPSEAL